LVRGCDTQVDPNLLDRVKLECRGKLCTHRNGQSHKSRVYTIVPGLAPKHNIGVYNNCVNAVERAFVERYFMCKTPEGFRPALPVEFSAYDSNENLKDFRSRLVAYMPHLPVLTSSQCVDLFPASKRKVYAAALESLERARISRKDARLSSFVKFEKQDVSKAPRIINPRSPRYNLLLGCYLKHAEHHYFTAINKCFGSHTRATVIKGFDADASAEILKAKWDRFSEPVAVGLDATKFDVHVSPAALRYEHSAYLSYYKPRVSKAQYDRLRTLLSWQLDNEGVAHCSDGKIKFAMEGTRCSGDVNTSLGNCIIMCALVYAYKESIGVDVELCNNGDDCVVIFERKHLNKFNLGLRNFFVRYGFDLTVEPPCYTFEEIEFCQTHPVALETGYRMVRHPATVFRKDTMCLHVMPNINVFRKWLFAVGIGGASLCSGVPVLESFYRAYIRNGTFSNKFRETNPHRFARTSTRSAKITDEARISFYHAFGVLPHMQVFMETFCDTIVIDELQTATIDMDDVVDQPGGQILHHAQE